MCVLLRELGLPITSHTALADDPEVALTAALGAARASSLRKHMRESDSAWPKHVGVVLNYLHERHCEPCSPSVPQASLRSLSFLERVGGGTQYIELQAVRNTVNQLTMDLQTGAPPKRQAPVLPLAMIAALEITVCDMSCSLYLRGFAFTSC